MSVTSHVYPYTIEDLAEKEIDLATDTIMMGLCTGSASTWGSTQEAYKFVSDVTGAYTEVTSSGYARATLSSPALSVSGAKMIFTCSSPISFGSDITLTAASAFVYDASVGSGDSSYPVICIIDFGEDVESTSGEWEYSVDGTNGLAYFTSS